MNIINLIQTKNKILSPIFPKTMARQAGNLFFTPMQGPIKDWEKEAENKGHRETYEDGLSAIRWGESDKRILLVHGFSSRATQMYGFVPFLLDAGFEVIAVDAPGHGQSPKSKANPLMVANTLLKAQKHFGKFYGAIGHSVGGAAIAIAANRGLDVEKSVLIAAPSSIQKVMDLFSSFMGLSPKSMQAFSEYVIKTVGEPPQALSPESIVMSMNSELFLIQDEHDVEVPRGSIEKIAAAAKDPKVLRTKDLGHRKIIRDKAVHEQVGEFFKAG